MTTNKGIFIIPFILMITLACGYVQNMVFPAVPTAALPTATATSLPPTSSPTVAPTATSAFEAACPDLLTEILKAATKNFVQIRGNEKPTHFLVLYTIKNNKLAQRQDLFVPEQLRSEWDARAKHESIWNYFKALIPEKDRTMVSEFSIMSDGHENILAG